MQETEIRMYSLICSNDGIKAREIAREVGVDKADINRLLYNIIPDCHGSHDLEHRQGGRMTAAGVDRLRQQDIDRKRLHEG